MRTRLAGLALCLPLVVIGCGDDPVTNPNNPNNANNPVDTCVPGTAFAGEILKSASPTGTKMVRVGFLAPMTGDSSSTGIEIRNVVQLAWETVDYKIGDIDVEVVAIDSFSDSAGSGTAKDNYAKAISACKLVAGNLNWHSGVAIDCMEVAAENKMPHFFGNGSSDAVSTKFHSDPKFKVWTKNYPAPVSYVPSYADAIASWIEAGSWSPPGASKKILLVHESGAYGKSWVRSARDSVEAADGYWKTNGWEVLPTVQIDDPAEFANQAAAAATDGATVILGTSTADAVGKFIKEARTAIPGAMIVMEGFGWSASALDDAGDSAALLLDGGAVNKFRDNKTADDLVANYKAAFAGASPDPGSGGISHDAALYFIEVLKKTAELHTDLTRENIQKVNLEQVQTGQLKFTNGAVMKSYGYTADSVPDPEYSPATYFFPIFQYQDEAGSIVKKVVYPVDQKEADPQFPAGS